MVQPVFNFFLNIDQIVLLHSIVLTIAIILAVHQYQVHKLLLHLQQFIIIIAFQIYYLLVQIFVLLFLQTYLIGLILQLLLLLFLLFINH